MPSNSSNILATRVRRKRWAGPPPRGAPGGGGGAGAVGSGLDGALGVENGVVPGLSLGIGAAGRRPHHVAGEKESAGIPGVPAREADLQVTEDREAEARHALPPLAVLLVDQELAEGEGLDLACVPREHLAPRRPRVSLCALLRIPEVLVGVGG